MVQTTIESDARMSQSRRLRHDCNAFHHSHLRGFHATASPNPPHWQVPSDQRIATCMSIIRPGDSMMVSVHGRGSQGAYMFQTHARPLAFDSVLPTQPTFSRQ